MKKNILRFILLLFIISLLPDKSLWGAAFSYATATDSVSCTSGEGRILIRTINGGPLFHYQLFSTPYTPGDTPIDYLYNTAVDTHVFSGLTAGNYRVEVGHTGMDTPAAYAVNVVLTDVLTTELGTPSITIVSGPTCNTSTDAILEAEVSGGIKPYSYSWSTGSTYSRDTVGSGIYDVTITDANGCGPKSASRYFIYNWPGSAGDLDSIPDAVTSGVISSDQDICDGDNPAALTNTTSPSGGRGSFTYDWEYQENCTGAWTSLGVNNETYDPPVLPNTRCFRRVEINSCGTVYSNTITITVNPNPTITATATPATICDGESSTLEAAGGSSYVWDNGLGAGISHSVSPSSTTTYTVTGTDANSCTNTASVTVTVNPLPASITGTTDVCVGSTTNLSSTTSGGTWSSSNTSVATINTSGMVTGISSGAATITYTLASGCSVSTVVTVNALPSAISGTTDVCESSTTILSSSPSGGTWSSSNTSIATVNSSGVVTGVSGGTVTITYTLGTGCSVSATVNVNPLPASITGTTDVCVGSTTTLSNTTSGGTWSSSNTSVATIDASGVVTGVSAGTATISYALGTGCSVSTTVTVNPLPAAITGTADVCEGSTTTLSNATSGGTWGSSNMSIATVNSSGVVTGVSGGTVTITYTLGTGCSVSTTVTVNPLPAAITGTTDVCVGSTTTLSNASSGGTWGSSNTSIATVNTSGVVSGVSAGTVTITYTLGTGCSVSATVTVNPLPAAITGTTDVCVGATTTLSSTTSGGTWGSSNTSVATIDASGVVTPVSTGTTTISYTLGTGCSVTTIVTVNPLPAAITGTTDVCEGSTTTLSSATSGGTWSSSNTSIATVNSSGVVTGVSGGTVTITYTLGTGCSVSTTVTVNPLPAAITGTTDVCEGSTTTLSSTTSGGTWSSSNASVATIDASGVVSGVSGGTTTISYTLGTGCSVTTIVTVNPLPGAITGTTDVCEGSTTTLSSATSGGTWSSSNTSIATVNSSGVVSGVSAGTVTITYTLGTGCSVTTTVTVNPLPASITGTTDVCVGSTTTLSNATSGGTWGSSNTSIATVNSSGVVSGVSAGTTTITYTLGTGCSVTTAVTVNPLPAIITGTTTLCEGSTTTLSNATSGGTWSSSNTSVATVNSSGVVSGLSGGTVTITYTLGTGCSVSTTVTVNPLPAAITGTTDVCVGSTTTLSNATSGGTWSSSNTSIATVNSSGVVTGVSGGTVTITYSLGTGCSVSATVTVNPLPASITGTTDVCVGSTTTLSNATSGGTWGSSNTSIATVNTSGVVSGVSAGTVTITYTLGTGCSISTTVTVNPLPASITGTTDVCVGSTTTLSNATSGGTWSSSNTSIATVNSSGVVTGVSGGTVTITYTLGTGCFVSATVTVNPLPAAITGTTDVCVGSTTTLSNATSGGIWGSSNTSIATVNTSGVVSGVSAGTVTITYTLGTGCSVSATVTVNPLPAAITGTTDVCVGSTTNLSSTTSGGTWSSSNTSIATVNTSGVVSGVSAGTVTIAYTLGTGCSVSATVTVNPLPAAITGTTDVCVGSTTTLSNATSGGTWSSSNASVATIDASGVVTPVSTGTTTISYTLGTGCSVTTMVTVNPLPAAITGTTDVCEGSTTTLSSATSGGTWSSSNTSIATVNSSGVVTGVSGGTVTITYTLGTGCSVSATVTVNPLPAAITGTTDVCVGSATTLSNATSGGTWSSSNTSIATVNSSGVVTGVSAGTTTITYTLGTGCSVSTTITVNPLPALITGATTLCESSTTTLSNATSGGTWSSSNTSIATVNSSGVVTGVSGGTVTITYTLGTGCSVSTTVTVNPLPASITGTTDVCMGSTTTLSNATSGGTWSSSNTSVATIDASGVVTGVSAGTATISYALGTGCSVSTTVTVNPLPAAITGTTDVCEGSTTTLSNATSGGTWGSSNTSIATVNSSGVVTGVSGGTVTITYTLGTGCSVSTSVTVNPLPAIITGTTTLCEGSTTTLSNATSGGTWGSSNTSIATVNSSGVVTGVSGGTVTITYTLGTGCFVSATVTVNPLPAAITGTTDVCEGSTTTLSNTTSGGTWSSSNTSIATVNSSGVVSGSSAGTVTITYTLGTGCSVSTTVTVNPLPAIIIGTTTLCEGSTTSLSNATTGGTWGSSNTSVATVNSSGLVTGVSGGTATISYTLGTGCSVSTTVTVNPLPGAISGPTEVCEGSSITLSSTTSGGTWSSSNTSVATIDASGVLTGVSGGTATITYTLGTGCFVTYVVTVNPLPAIITGATEVCEGSTIILANATSGGSWSSSNTSIATVDASGIVTGVSSGTTDINYTLGTGCLVSVTITVNSLPAAIIGTTDVCEGSSTTLSSTTLGGTWSSSNASVATINASGVVTGVNSGIATISYTLATGCSVSVTITVNPLPASITGPTEVCDGSTITLSNTTSGGSWSSSNTSIATVDASGIVTGVSSGTADISYTLGTGCSVSVTVTVNPLPTIIATATPDTICFGESSTLDATGGTSYIWDNGLGGGAIKTVTPVITTKYLVMGTDANGCSNTDSVTVTVNPLPAIVATATPDTICYGDNSTISASGGTSYVWDNGLGAGAIYVVSPTITTDYIVTGTDANSCVNKDTVTVIVNPLPTVIANSNSPVCEGTTLNLFGGADATYTYSWTGPDSFTNTDRNPVVSTSATLTMAGTYQVTATDTNGCQENASTTVIIRAAPVIDAGLDTTICNGDNVTLTHATITGGTLDRWGTTGDGTFDDATLLTPTYTPGTQDIADGEVTLYIDVIGTAPCGLYSDSLMLTIPAPVQPSIGSPAPFYIDSTTIFEVCITTSGHGTAMDMGLYLVAPDGITTMPLQKGLRESSPLRCFSFPQGDVDVCFTNAAPYTSADSIDYCTDGLGGSPNVGPYAGAYGAQGDIKTFKGFNPAEGGWSIMVRDVDQAFGGIDGAVTHASISFQDTAIATGLLKTIDFESGVINEDIMEATDNNIVIQRGLQVSCFGECDAEAIVSVNGGTAPYVSYNWSPTPATTNALGDSVSLCAGTYTVTVTDSIGCTGVTSVTVTEPPQIAIDTAYYTDTIDCYGDSTGYIVVKASGGTGTLSYMILGDSTVSASADSGYFPDLKVGTYTIEVKDGSACSIDTIFTIYQPQAISIDTAYISDTIVCFGDNRGKITVTASGGTLPYTFILPGIDTNSTGIFTGVPGGLHNIFVTDANGCDTVMSDTLTMMTPAPLFIDTVLVEDIACYGDFGSLAIAIKGGSMPYQVFVDSGATFIAMGITDTAFVSNLTAGNYDVFVMDTNGCSIVDTTVTINEPLAPITVDTAYFTDRLFCNADTNGYIVVKGLGGLGTISYRIVEGDKPSESADSGYFSNLEAGTYTVQMTDSVGCTLDTIFNINAPLAISIDTAYISDTILCYGDGKGEITVTASGGTLPYTFILPGVDTNNTGIFAGVPGGLHNIFVTDVNGCDTVKSGTLTMTTPAPLFIDTVIAINAVCGGNDGFIKIVGNGGTRPYRFSLDGGGSFIATGITSDTTMIGGLPAGSYDVTLFDTNDCSTTYATVTIYDPPKTLMIDSVSITDESGCYGSLNGEILVHASGGWGDTLLYSINSLPYRTDSLFTGLVGGSYTVHVSDSLGCIASKDTVVGGPAPLVLSILEQNVQGTVLGSVSLNASGGTPGPAGNEYEYWLDSVYIADTALRTWVPNNVFSNLPVDTYQVSIRDGNGCYIDSVAHVYEDVLNARVRLHNPTCYGDDWSLVVEIDDATLPVYLGLFGIPDYKTYSTALPVYDSIVVSTPYSGNLMVHLEDITGVTYDTTVVVTAPVQVIVPFATIVPKTCQTEDLDGNKTWDGEIHQVAVNSSGDTLTNLTYTLSLYNPGTGTSLELESNTTGDFTGLGKYGSYRVTVTDTSGCKTTVEDDYNISGKHTFTNALVGDTTLCKYNTIQLVGGQGFIDGKEHPINYEWSPDTIFDDATINNPSFTMLNPVTVKLRSYDNSCQTTHTSVFSMFDTVGMKLDLVGGNVVLDTNADGDTIYGTVGNLAQIKLPNGYRYTDWSKGFIIGSDTIFISVQNGDHYKGVRFLEETGDTTYSFYIDDDTEKYYAIGLTDTGCVEMMPVAIRIRQEILHDSIYTVFTPNGDGVNDTWTIDYSSQYPDLEIKIINRWGQTVYYRKGYGDGSATEWDGTNMKNGKDLPIGTYYYIITPNDGQTEPFSGTVTIIR